MVKGPLDRPVDFVNSPHTGPYDTCLDLRPELWAETDSAIMFVNPIVCFRSDLVANKIGRWTGVYFVPCDRKMLSVVGIVRKRVEPRHMTHHVDQPKLTLISKSFTNSMINQQLQLQEWQLIHLYRFICTTIIPMSQYLRRVLHNHFFVNGQNFITRV